MSSGIYNVLINSIGYFDIEHSDRGSLLIYRDYDNLEEINIDELNPADRRHFEITIEIVDDYQIHLSSNGKEGSHKEKISVSKLSSFTIRR